MKILFIQYKQIGDVLLTTPAIRAIKKIIPDAVIDFLVNKGCSAVLRNNLFINKLIFADEISFFKQIFLLRDEKYDVAIDFMGTPKSARITFLSGAKKRIGFKKRFRTCFYNKVIPQMVSDMYVVKRKCELLKPLNIKVDNFAPEIFTSVSENSEAESVLNEFYIKGKENIIAFSPVSRRSYKRWSLSYFAEVCDSLANKYNYKFLPLFGPGEEEVINKVISLSKNKNAFLFPYKPTSFNALKPLIENCKFYFGNDNGIRHVAIACNKPTFTIFGKANPINWTPSGDKHISFWCKGDLRSIKPEEVIGRIVESENK